MFGGLWEGWENRGWEGFNVDQDFFKTKFSHGNDDNFFTWVRLKVFTWVMLEKNHKMFTWVESKKFFKTLIFTWVAVKIIKNLSQNQLQSTTNPQRFNLKGKNVVAKFVLFNFQIYLRSNSINCIVL